MPVRRSVRAYLVVLALAVLITGVIQPTFGADSPGYYSYLRSLAFDRDLDFANEYEALGGTRRLTPTATGRMPNPYSIGPAIVWMPFFAVAHLYVLMGRTLGLVDAAADGMSAPYLRSAYLGTLVVAVTGAWFLRRVIAARLGDTWATLAVVTATAASPVLYYILVLPAMAHALVFGAVGGLIWAADRVSVEPTRPRWWLLGFLTGLVALLRWQAAVCGVLFLLCALEAARRKQLSWRWLSESAVIGLATIVPQLVAWRVIYGTWLAVPQGAGFFDWSSSRMWDVLMHADRGFFVWTPVMAVSAIGLVLGWRRWGTLAVAGLCVLALTIWVNGSLVDWAGSDSFGSRRFDLVVPFLALGLASALHWQAQRPALLPTLMAAFAILWSVGFMGLYLDREITEAAPLERLATYQARRLRRSAESAADALGGPRLRALAYKALVGEYFYWNLNPSGTIDLSNSMDRHLAGGWSEVRWEDNRPKFRWAFPPRACVSVPLERPIDLRTQIRARAPGRLTEAQTVTVELNGIAVTTLPLPEEWSDLQFTLPATSIVPGENLICLTFAHTAHTTDGRDVGAAVARIQLP